MEFFTQLIDIVLHLDRHLQILTMQYGTMIYALLFAIIFSETGFVVTPFLPGDTLLFVAGALSAVSGGGYLNIYYLMICLTAAAFLGNQVNYAIGRYLGPKVFQWPNSRFFNRDALLKTHQFYEKHGGKTIILSRFLPFFRTFAPFVAGIGSMNPFLFALYNIIGALLWVVSLCLLGYFLGNLAVVKNNLTLIIVLILLIPSIPAIIGYWRSRKKMA